MITLRGMAWDHPRGIDPLRAAADNFTSMGEPVRIDWDARPLQQFEDTPIDELGRRYDLIAIDHPLIGDACVPQSALRDLAALVSPGLLADAEQGSLGPSFASYRWQGHQYALPIDAAAQVSAYREDVIGQPPRTWDDLTGLAEGLPHGQQIALAASPTHLYATWLSLCNQYRSATGLRADGRPFWWTDDDGVDPGVGRPALETLYRLLDLCAVESLWLDPIGLLDAMSTGDQFVYTPFVFGYCTYGRIAVPHRLSFAGPPSMDGGPVGTVLGGVGLAISARCVYPKVAAEFVEHVVAGPYQRTEYVLHQGQPAHADAWRDASADRLTGGFFSETRSTIERSFLRPRVPGYPAFQAAAGRVLHEAAQVRRRPGEVLETVAVAWRDLCRAKRRSQ